MTRNDLLVEIMAAMNDERVTLEILVAALGVLEGVTDHTFNPGVELMPAYEAGRNVGAGLPGGVDVDEEDAPTPAEVGDKVAQSIVGDVVIRAEDGQGAYLGNANDGAWFAVAPGPDGLWYMSAIVDCDTAGFVDNLVIDEPHDTLADAMAAGHARAVEWCVLNGVALEKKEDKTLGVEELIDFLKEDEDHFGPEWASIKESWHAHMQRERKLRASVNDFADAVIDQVKWAMSSEYNVEEEETLFDDFFAFLINKARSQIDL
jgi:hypothetical protein